MSSVLVNVGLDYHEESIRVCVTDGDGEPLANVSTTNDPLAIFTVVARYGSPRAVAIEACCGAANFAEALHRLTGWKVKLAHPGYVRRLKQGPDKSDHDDAALLADLVRVNYLPEVWLAPDETRQLRRLVRYRQGLVADRRNIKLRIRALLREERVPMPTVRPWTKAWIAWLKMTPALGEQSRWVLDRELSRLQEMAGQIAEVEGRLQQVTAEDPTTQKLLEQPGVGLITAVTLRAEIGRFHRFASGKQLARFCGVTPCNRSSGQRQADAGLVKAGHGPLRSVLIQAAKRLPRHDPRWKAFHRKLSRTKPANVVTAAIANRWIRWLYHQMVPEPAVLAG
jgi:transposase